MTANEIVDVFKWFNNSWKSHGSVKGGGVYWVDWNGERHVAFTKEELWNQLMEAPQCQTKVK